MKTYLLEEMTWPEIQAAMKNGCDTVVIYAASIEQHGPALPEMTDTILGYAAASDLAKRLGNALAAPLIRPGLSAHHMCFPGSITLRPETFRAVVEDYISAYVHHGFRTIVLASSHGGNFHALEEIAQQQSEQYPHVRIVCGCSLEELDAALAEVEVLEGLPVGTCGGHACDWETSVMMMLNEDYVRREKLQRGHVGALTEELLHRFFEDGVMSVSEIGVMGDPTGADAARGIRYFQYMQDMQEKAVRKHLMEWDKKKCNQHAE